MKKFISFLCAFLILISAVSLSAFAVENTPKNPFDISNFDNPELDLTNITMDDLMDMSPQAYSALVSEFERVYDPFDSYVEEEKEIIIEDMSELGNFDNLVSPCWTSGNTNILGDYTDIGTHEYITLLACDLLIEDKGFFSDSSSQAAIILAITLSSILPDKEFSLGLGQAYKGHFYDPDTGKNYDGDTTNTAKTNAILFYNEALDYFTDNDITNAFENLGKCLHYIQDACEPHHASNVRDVIDSTSHGDFEEFAFAVAEISLESYVVPTAYYNNASTWTITQIVNYGAIRGKALIDTVNGDMGFEWGATAQTTLRYATGLSAMVMYKMGQENGVSFSLN